MWTFKALKEIINYNLGYVLRETGLLLDKKGAKCENDISYKQKLSRHRTIFPINYVKPQLEKNTKICYSSTLAGNVSINENSIIMNSCTLRGDFNSIRIGKNSYVGDNTIIITSEVLTEGYPSSTNIGDNVIIGNNCIINSSTIDDNVIIEDNCIIKEGSIIESNTIIRNGSVVQPFSNLKGNGDWEGQPIKLKSKITTDKEFEEKKISIKKMLDNYQDEIFI